MKIKKTKSEHFRKISKDNTKQLGEELGAIIENNPQNYPATGSWKNAVFSVNEKCVGCAQCEQHCPEAAILIKEIGGKKRALIDQKFCKGCGICQSICPLAAVEVKGDEN